MDEYDKQTTNYFGGEYESRQEHITELDQSGLFGSEGSGDQKKIWMNNQLHKLNSKYHEDDKEVAASVLGKAFGLDCVEYHSARYRVRGTVYKGCYCDSYLKDGEESVSFAYIFQQVVLDVPMKMPAAVFYNKTIQLVADYTGLHYDNLDEYMMNLLVLDFLICNPDRHFSNIEVIYNPNTEAYRLAPIFDCGQSFLRRSTMPSRDILDSELYKFKTKPFSTNPKKNLIDIPRAKEIAQQFVNNAGGVEGIRTLEVGEFFKYLVLRRYHDILSY